MKKKYYWIIGTIVIIIVLFFVIYIIEVFGNTPKCCPPDVFSGEITKALSKAVDIYGAGCVKENNNWKINFKLGHNSYPVNRDEKYELYVIFNGNNVSDEDVKNYDIEYKNVTGTTIGTTIIEPEYSYLFSFTSLTTVNLEVNNTLIVVSPACGPDTCDKINVICP